MSETFGPAALRLCALAARLLGWRPAEFWAATPAELTAIVTDAETRAPRTNPRATSFRPLSVTRFPLVGV